MKLKHNIPSQAFRLTEPVTAAYQAVVDATSDAAMAAVERAERRLEAAERKAEKIRLREQSAKASPSHALAVALELVEIRREQLLELSRLMNAAPASSAHRGKGYAHRPVPQIGSVV